MPPAPPDHPPQTPDTQYVPFEKRESQNIKPTPFILDYAALIGVTVFGAIAGVLIGKVMEPRNISLGKLAKWKFGSDKLDRTSGMVIGTEVAGIWGLFQHWKKSEGKQLGIKNVTKDLHEALSPEQLEQDTQKEEALLADLQRLQERLNKPVSHGATVTTRREAAPQQTGIG